MDEIVALSKRRGFVYPASEIYGGINGFWDYGPLGVQLKNNIRDYWWNRLVECPPIGPNGEPVQIVGLDSSIIQNPKTWIASGHVGGFNDPMVDDTETKKRYRADHLVVFRPSNGDGLSFAFVEGEEDGAEKKIKKIGKRSLEEYERVSLMSVAEDAYANIVGPDTKKPGTLTQPRMFNLMFETYVGAVQSDDDKSYLRPETAQGIFLNYKNVLDTMRVKVPFGIAQVGKAFRNEVTPRNFIFRSREFEQMEMEWFCHPDEAAQWYDFWKNERMDWWTSMGVDAANLRFRDHADDELAHYSKMCVDIEYKYPFTDPEYGELEGIAHRGSYDLEKHEEHSSKKMQYRDVARDNETYIPNVIEPASGLTRGVLVLLCESYTPTPDRKGSKCILKLLPRFAPIKAGVFPLFNKEGMPEVARQLYLDIRQKFVCDYDGGGNIGKRYARMDEVGTPYCFTIDHQTLEDQTVTVRHRDDARQDRISLSQVEPFLTEHLG